MEVQYKIWKSRNVPVLNTKNYETTRTRTVPYHLARTVALHEYSTKDCRITGGCKSQKAYVLVLDYSYSTRGTSTRTSTLD